MDIMRPRHAPLQLLELFDPHVSKQCCHNHVSGEQNKLLHSYFFLSVYATVPVFAPTFKSQRRRAEDGVDTERIHESASKILNFWGNSFKKATIK